MLTEITVRGMSGASRPPERGTVLASISYAGPSMEPVYSRVARDLEIVQASVAELKDGEDPAITWWSADRLRTWSTRPWNQDGELLPLEHHASVSLQVKFREFTALSSWVSRHVTQTEGFRVTNIGWTLTAERRDELVRQVREHAVHDAVERAQQYADALGLGTISPVAIADAGMLVANLRPEVGTGQTYAVTRAPAGHSAYGSNVELVPQDIEVTASVDARFIADGSNPRSSHLSDESEETDGPTLEPEQDPNVPSVFEYRDDDAGYLAWCANHRDGFVINILRRYSAKQARVHRADCWTLSGAETKKGALTGTNVKVCAGRLADLEQWAVNQVGHPIQRCGTCFPGGSAAQPVSPEGTEPPMTAPTPEIRHGIRGPRGSGVVEAWADDYIKFGNLPEWQRRLRGEIRTHCGELDPSADQVLHATFFGPKHPRADIENLLLYNIDTFRIAGANGIRFEHGSGLLPATDDQQYQFGYRYALAPRSGTFEHWQRGRTLASFGWIDLGDSADETKLAPVWLALSRGETRALEPIAPDAPFALRLEISPPDDVTPAWGGLMKGIFDGVICAVQAHTDRTVLPDVVARLAETLPADSAEIEQHLLDQRRAVLGVVHRLVAPYGKGVKWDPCDHLCVAGELLAAESALAGLGDRWAIRGEVFEVTR
ncbi:SIMPL domain-containing protein [Mycobacterium sp. IS-1496]|uniref:SIMPL domain-containing protein n=1 Tax=Mycobacterium sp. IS-1496 TaxID=1772284 RepID=UPI0009E7A81C|nr:SIMPL domain-containing protein [Mycobacterium sp. IS-1496]